MRSNGCRLVSVLAVLAVVGWFTVATAAGQQRPGRDQAGSAADFVRRQLKANDKNGDGKISRQEAAGRLSLPSERRKRPRFPTCAPTRRRF